MARPIHPVVVGTAGHVDHGKSSLVRQLTGIDPDRLQEEKERGLTIDLGFARIKLPDGRYVGIFLAQVRVGPIVGERRAPALAARGLFGAVRIVTVVG